MSKKDASAAQAKALKLEEEISDAASPATEVKDVKTDDDDKPEEIEDTDEDRDEQEQGDKEDVGAKVWGRGELAIRGSQSQAQGTQRLQKDEGEKPVGRGGREVGGQADDVDTKARKVSDAQIKRYWKDVDGGRIAPRGMCHFLFYFLLHGCPGPT